ncbi:MAG: hypothetical protein HY855_10905 [Burkholderiales bacterium]|nr:hypothetical protein [Burkholderiales bacterium]
MITTSTLKNLARTGLLVGLAAAAQLALAQSSFTATYKGGSSSTCGSTYSISGMEPTASGKYPVYVHIGGTGESYTSNWANAAVKAAAAKGFVAASIQYDNSTFGTCSTIGQRAKCIFNPSNVNSAIAKLCARAKADCSKGIVTGGLSQGSVISVLAKNYDSRVRASMGQGNGTAYSVYDLSSCMANGKHTQPGNRIRIINGQMDMFVGGSVASAGASGQRVTGAVCPSGTQNCLQSNGSGWYVVTNSQVQDLYADHCFMGYGGNDLIAQCSGTLVDGNYQNGNSPWALGPTLDWLKTFVTP